MIKLPRYYNDFSDFQSPALQHYGVQGMKWGIRKYVNYDGTLTEEGKRKYGTYQNFYKAYTENKKGQRNTRQVVLENKYKNEKGMSQRAAEVKAIGQRQTERNLKIAAGVTMAAVAAGVAGKAYYDYAADKVIGTNDNPIRRMQYFNGHDNRSGAVYGVFDNKRGDATKYNGVWAAQQWQVHRLNQAIGKEAKDIDPYRMELRYNNGKGIKMASRKNMKRVFNDLVKNDEEFRNAWNSKVSELNKAGAGKHYGFWGVNGGEKGLKGDYKDFVANIPYYGKQKPGGGFEGKESAMAKRYYDALKKAGYGAMHDINDEDRSGYFAKAAIMFDGTYKWNSHKLSADEINAATVKGREAMNKDQTWKLITRPKLIKTGIAVLGMAGIGKAAASTKTVRAQTMYNAGASYSEIAKALGVPENQVGGYLSKTNRRRRK